PGLLASLYEPNGADLVLAAHANAQAPAHCRRAAPLPYTGSSHGLSAGWPPGCWARAGCCWPPAAASPRPRPDPPQLPPVA
ncbi:MAG: hypothetical protein ACJ75E_14570, partial [Actinomycetes bacterium]